MSDRLLSGWGRSVWSRARVVPARIDADVVAALGDASSAGLIARGLGRSYGDQATNAGGAVLDMTGFRPGPVAEPDDAGVVTVSAGLSIDQLLAELVPRGWFVPVTAGTRHITVGGAIAADIHGKNHHVDGTFCNHVRELTLVLADGTVARVGPAADPELFWATAGGMGLTGVVVDATVSLSPIETSRVLVDTSRHDDLDDLLAAMVEADRHARFSVAWVDLATRTARGRSVLTTGRFARADELPAGADPLAYAPRQRLRAPRWLPNGVLRPATVRGFNAAWFRRAPRRRSGEVATIARFFHPLDGVAGWNRIYGPHGFLQWQMVVPDGAEDVLRACVERLGGAPAPCFLAVLKRLGDANPGPLSFPTRGWTLAADIPALAPGLAELLDELDRAVADAGGRIYLAKDARLDPALLAAMYPRLDEWRAVRERVDPGHRLRSDMAVRLGL